MVWPFSFGYPSISSTSPKPKVGLSCNLQPLKYIPIRNVYLLYSEMFSKPLPQTVYNVDAYQIDPDPEVHLNTKSANHHKRFFSRLL